MHTEVRDVLLGAGRVLLVVVVLVGADEHLKVLDLAARLLGLGLEKRLYFSDFGEHVNYLGQDLFVTNVGGTLF